MKIIEGWKLAGQGKKLLVDLSLMPSWTWGSRAGDKVYNCDEELTDLPTSQIISMGYREAEGWKDGLAFYRMPVYVKFHGFVKCDYRHGYIDRWGEPTDAMHGAP